MFNYVPLALGSGKGIFFIKKKSCKSDSIQTFGFTKKFVGGGWEAKLKRTQLYWTIHNFNSSLRVEKGFLRLFSRVIVVIVVPVTSSWFIVKFSDLQRDSIHTKVINTHWHFIFLSTYLSFSICVAATWGISRASR